MKPQNQQKLLERVRKLYAMSQAHHASPYEAEIALRRCQSLMTRFGISEADLETSEFGKEAIGRGFRTVPSHVALMGSAVALLHDCLCVQSGRLEFRGYALDAKVASMTFDYLSSAMERSLKQQKNDGEVEPGRSASHEYRVGYAMAVLERVKVIDAERRHDAEASDKHQDHAGSVNALVQQKQQRIREAYGQDLARARPRRIRYRTGNAHRAGARDGKQVSLDNQIESEPVSSICKSRKTSVE